MSAAQKSLQRSRKEIDVIFRREIEIERHNIMLLLEQLKKQQRLKLIAVGVRTVFSNKYRIRDLRTDIKHKQQRIKRMRQRAKLNFRVEMLPDYTNQLIIDDSVYVVQSRRRYISTHRGNQKKLNNVVQSIVANVRFKNNEYLTEVDRLEYKKIAQAGGIQTFTFDVFLKCLVKLELSDSDDRGDFIQQFMAAIYSMTRDELNTFLDQAYNFILLHLKTIKPTTIFTNFKPTSAFLNRFEFLLKFSPMLQLQLNDIETVEPASSQINHYVEFQNKRRRLE